MTAATVPSLTDEQVDQYWQCGYVLLPPEFLERDVFAGAVTALPDVLAERSEAAVLESDQVTIRSVYGIHRSTVAMSRVARHPAIVGAARQLLDDDVYVHQSKVNVKAAFSGEQWGWHQDYIYWLSEDHLPRPRLVNVAVFADAVTAYNGPLTFIPGSHQHGVLAGEWSGEVAQAYAEDPSWISTLTATEKFEISQQTIRAMAQTNGLDAPSGPAGSVLLFHPNLLHASPPNMSPFGRTMIMFIYNAVSNRDPNATSSRPWFLAEPAPMAAAGAEGVSR